MTKLVLYTSLIFMGLFAASCEPDDPDVDPGGEVITEVVYTLTATDGSSVEFKFLDADGDGGNDPVITNPNLAANTQYTGAIRLFNGDEEITAEIEEEDEDHQLFLESELDGLVIAYDDMDADGKPVGLKTTFNTGAAGSGKLTITLRHLPMKSAAGVEDGELANAEGETDIEVIFDLNVE